MKTLIERATDYCKELSWFRGCDDWELDDFLIEINKDRAKAVDLLDEVITALREQAAVALVVGELKSAVVELTQQNDELQARIEELEADRTDTRGR
jgi:chromosome segregation ATPase